MQKKEMYKRKLERERLKNQYSEVKSRKGSINNIIALLLSYGYSLQKDICKQLKVKAKNNKGPYAGQCKYWINQVLISS